MLRVEKLERAEKAVYFAKRTCNRGALPFSCAGEAGAFGRGAVQAGPCKKRKCIPYIKIILL